MSELVTFTAPVTKPNQTTANLTRVSIDLIDRSIYVEWIGNNNEESRAFYPTPPPNGSSQPSGATLLHNLNTANFSVNSLVKNVFQRLITDGYLPAGTVSGTPS